MIAAGWSTPEIAAKARGDPAGLVRPAHRGRRPRPAGAFGGLGPVLARGGRDADRHRLHRLRGAAPARLRPPRASDPRGLRRVGMLIRQFEETARQAGRRSRCARVGPTRTASSTATGVARSTRSSATADERPSLLLARRGRSSTRASGRPRCRTSPATTGSSRSTAAATAAPTARRAPAYTHVEFAADTSRCSTPPAPTGPCSSRLSCGALWSVQVAADHPERVLGLVAIGPAGPLAPGLPERSGPPVRRARSSTTKAGRSTTGTTGRGRLRRLPRVLLRPDVHRAALDQADRGLHRVGPRDRPAHAGRDRRGPAAPADATSFALGVRRACACPVLVIHGDEDRIRPHAQGARPGRGHRRHARHGRGRRPRHARLATRCSSTA